MNQVALLQVGGITTSGNNSGVYGTPVTTTMVISMAASLADITAEATAAALENGQ